MADHVRALHRRPHVLHEAARRGLTGADPAAPVFANSHGAPLSHSPWPCSVWLPAGKQAGLAGLRFHDLRSPAATALVAAGVDV